MDLNILTWFCSAACRVEAFHGKLRKHVLKLPPIVGKKVERTPCYHDRTSSRSTYISVQSTTSNNHQFTSPSLKRSHHRSPPSVPKAELLNPPSPRSSPHPLNQEKQHKCHNQIRTAKQPLLPRPQRPRPKRHTSTTVARYPRHQSQRASPHSLSRRICSWACI